MMADILGSGAPDSARYSSSAQSACSSPPLSSPSMQPSAGPVLLMATLPSLEAGGETSAGAPEAALQRPQAQTAEGTGVGRDAEATDRPRRSDSGAGALPTAPSSKWEDSAASQLATHAQAITRLLPWLYLSGHAPPGDKQALAERKVAVAINCAGEVCQNAFESISASGVSYLTFCVRDGAHEDLAGLFYEAIQAIEGARQQGKAALIHCHMGVSRSASIAIAYLMWASAGSLSWTAALAYARALRPIVSPNIGFLCQLKEWEQHCTVMRQAVAGQGGERLYRLQPHVPGCYRAGPLFPPPPTVAAGGPGPTRQVLTHCLVPLITKRERAPVPPSTGACQVAIDAGEALLLVCPSSHTDQSGAAAHAYLVLPATLHAQGVHAAQEAATRELGRMHMLACPPPSVAYEVHEAVKSVLPPQQPQLYTSLGLAQSVRVAVHPVPWPLGEGVLQGPGAHLNAILHRCDAAVDEKGKNALGSYSNQPLSPTNAWAVGDAARAGAAGGPHVRNAGRGFLETAQEKYL